MLRALLERDIVPDLIVGTSIGAINGAAVAAEPTIAVIETLETLWKDSAGSGIFTGSMLRRARTLTRSRTHLHDLGPLRALLRRSYPVQRIEDLRVPFQCVAACIETASEHWFEKGSLVDAICASSAVPGLLPTVEIGGRHFYDGGLVNSIPVDRAVALGATQIFVLQVGRIEQALSPPQGPLEVAVVAFEIARRHRFIRGLGELPGSVEAHVLPSGDPPSTKARAQLRYSDTSRIPARIAQAHSATARYLDAIG